MTVRVMRPKLRRPRSLQHRRQLERAKAQEEETVALLRELRDQTVDPNQWTPKVATWNLAILAAEGKLRRKGSK